MTERRPGKIIDRGSSHSRPQSNRTQSNNLTGYRLAGDRQYFRKIAQSSRRQWRRIAVAGLLFWALYALALGSGGAMHYYQLKKECNRLSTQNQKMVSERDSLDLVISAITNLDQKMIEKIAREEYGLIRSNERIYLLPTTEPADGQ